MSPGVTGNGIGPEGHSRARGSVAEARAESGFTAGGWGGRLRRRDGRAGLEQAQLHVEVAARQQLREPYLVGPERLGGGARAVVEDAVLRCERTPPLPAHRS